MERKIYKFKYKGIKCVIKSDKQNSNDELYNLHLGYFYLPFTSQLKKAYHLYQHYKFDINDKNSIDNIIKVHGYVEYFVKDNTNKQFIIGFSTNTRDDYIDDSYEYQNLSVDNVQQIMKTTIDKYKQQRKLKLHQKLKLGLIIITLMMGISAASLNIFLDKLDDDNKITYQNISKPKLVNNAYLHHDYHQLNKYLNNLHYNTRYMNNDDNKVYDDKNKISYIKYAKLQQLDLDNDEIEHNIEKDYQKLINVNSNKSLNLYINKHLHLTSNLSDNDINMPLINNINYNLQQLKLATTIVIKTTHYKNYQLSKSIEFMLYIVGGLFIILIVSICSIIYTQASKDIKRKKYGNY